MDILIAVLVTIFALGSAVTFLGLIFGITPLAKTGGYILGSVVVIYAFTIAVLLWQGVFS